MGECNIAPNTQIGAIIMPEKVYDHENIYNNEKYSRSGEFLENYASKNTVEFAHRYFKLANYMEFLKDMEEISSLGYMNDNMIPVNNEGLINPFINLAEGRLIPGILENSTIQPGIIFYEYRTDFGNYKEEIDKKAEEKEKERRIKYGY